MRVHWNWGIGIAAVYGVFASATIGFAWFAMSEPVDLVSDDYYAESLAHDARLAAVARADGLGAHFVIDTDVERDQLVVRWPPDMAPAATGWIRLYRPSDANEDRVIAVRPAPDGRQAIALAGLVPGRWVVKVEWNVSGVTYYAERAIVSR